IAILISLILLSEVLALLFRGINLGQHHIIAYNVSALLQRLLLLVGVLILTGMDKMRIETVLGAWLGATAVSIGVSGAWIWRRTGSSELSGEVMLAGWPHSLRRGLKALLTIGLTMLLLRTDVYMLGRLMGMGAVGQVSVASTFAEY